MKPPKILRREDVPRESTWNREAVYASWADWQAEFDTAQKELPTLKDFAGTLKNGPDTLLRWFKTYSQQWRRVAKLFLFTRMATAVDGTDLEAKTYAGRAMAFYAKFSAATAFAEPELIALDDTLFQWADELADLALYRHYFDNLIRNKPHLRSAEVEEILSQLADPFDQVFLTAEELTNTDMQFADAVDSQGKTHPVYQASPPPTGIQSIDREHRRTAWESFSDSHLSMQNALASNYITLVKQQVFLAKTRGYDSVLAMRLAPANLPLSVFHNVINTFKDNLSVWHRYWTVRRKILKLETLHPYDIWAPLVNDPPVIPYQQAVDWICEAMAPLGEDYVNIMRRGCLEDRWVDYAPNIGKTQGAASSRRIDLPPFIFMSYDNTWASMSTLAHELGHSMHTYLVAENQPQVYNNFEVISSSVTETASNFNQALLRHHLKEQKKDDHKLTVARLNEGIGNFHRYFFIMPTLARFEFEVFTRAEQDQPLNAEILNQIMSDLYAEGYGETLTDDPKRTGITWAQFMHLFSPFYTFQYTVGISAANALAEGVLNGEANAVENYLKFLCAGGALYPADLFKLAGVDMSTAQPIEKAFGVLADMIDQLEAVCLLD